METTDTILAYMAGLVDGEGCLTIARQNRKERKNPSFKTSVTVSNTDRRLVDIFKEHFGGCIYETKDKRVSKGWANSFTWHCTAGNSRIFLKAILPYLIAKKQQAILILEFQEMQSKYVRKSFGQGLGTKGLNEQDIANREYYHNAVRSLNLKGQFSRANNIIHA